MTNLIMCPSCNSDDIYQYKQPFEFSGVGEELLPKLGKGPLGVATIRPYVCGSCGFVSIVAPSETLKRLKQSEHWKKL